MSPSAAILANALVLGWIVYGAILQRFAPDLYYMTVQEDEYIEWATFFAFAGAAVVYFNAVRRERRAGTAWPWFAFGVAAFCIFVAMEEISWGQRLLGYRPPEYFLRENFQQEPNIHNVFDTSLRKVSLQLVIGGYGIALPLLPYIGGVARLLERIGITAPSPQLVPAFAGTLALYMIYPWSHSGEIVELMLGLAFLFAAPGARPATIVTPLGLCTTVFVLGLAATMTAHIRKSSDEAYTRMAQAEIDALGGDFIDASRPGRGTYLTRCNLHKRVYTYVEKYRHAFLRYGRFSELKEQGLPEQRIEYFLDPWNAPYWIRDHCDQSRKARSIFVYSFGPNKRRDSNESELRGDDIGRYILAPR